MYLLDTHIVSELRKPRPHGGVVAWRTPNDATATTPTTPFRLVGAHTFIERLPADVVAVGNPARVVRTISEDKTD